MKSQAVAIPAQYPTSPSERDRWILSRRSPQKPLDARRPYAFHLEQERAESGEIVSVATIFLTNRECPWRCLMCDLWQNTLTEAVPIGAIPAQIQFALESLRTIQEPAEAGKKESPRPASARAIKLYNSGSFFDTRAIPSEDHAAIAAIAQSFERIVVECHPSLIGESTLRFRDLLVEQASSLSFSRTCSAAVPAASSGTVPVPGTKTPSSPSAVPSRHADGSAPLPTASSLSRVPQLEVAMGLETAHPEVLEKLNKRMTLDQFKHAATFLREHHIALRTFILIKPPFLDEAGALHWARRSLDFAFDCGTTVASLIPTRPGNGALDALMAQGEFSPPHLATIEAAAEYGISLGRGRVFADLWDLEKFSDCPICFPARRARLHQMNLAQELLPPVTCPHCAARDRTGVPPLPSGTAGGTRALL